MQYRPETGDSEIQLQVSKSVPCQGADALTLRYAHGGQRSGYLLGPTFKVGIGATMYRSLERSRNDFGVWMCIGGVLNQRGNEQLMILH